MTIGAIMGMMGIPLPVNTRSGKGKFGWRQQWYGGVIGEWTELYTQNEKSA